MKSNNKAIEFKYLHSFKTILAGYFRYSSISSKLALFSVAQQNHGIRN